MTIRIRRATLEDVDAIAKIHVDTWRTQYITMLPEGLLDSLSYKRSRTHYAGIMTNDPTKFLFVAESDTDGAIGFTMGGVGRESGPFQGELYSIYILAPWQRQGIGSRLIQALAHELHHRGINSMLAWVLEANPAKAFYEQHGGHYLRERMEPLGRESYREIAYGWTDLHPLLTGENDIKAALD